LIFRLTTWPSAGDLDFLPSIAIFQRSFFSSAELFIPPLDFSIFRKRRRRSVENLNVHAAIPIFAGEVRHPAGDLNFPPTLRIFSGKVHFSAELLNCPVAVSNFRRNAQRSAGDLNFWLNFSIFTSCFEFSAELLKLPRHFYFSPRCRFLLAGGIGNHGEKKRNPARVLNYLRIGRIPLPAD
jgi:hypothetical protein